MATYNPPITVTYTNHQEHVMQAEIKNQYIKEHFRSVYHRLPFDHLPREIVKYLGLESARKPNMFTEKHEISEYYIPRMIVCQEYVDYENRIKIPSGTYVLANNKPKTTNTNAQRRLD